jgi:serine/threonine protein kinase
MNHFNNIEYIKSGSNGHTLKGNIQINNCECNYAIKIVTFHKYKIYKDYNDKNRPENAEILMLKLLSYFVINNITPHIILPITTFNTKFDILYMLKNKINIDNIKLDKAIESYENNILYDNVSILISEWANGGDLSDYIKNNYKNMKLKDWRIIFFQIISTLAIIFDKYPSFRHNDLKANNILVYKLNKNKNKNNKFIYQINNSKYIVPDIGIQIKIWDFDFACIPGIVDNYKVSYLKNKINEYNIQPERNQYYDLHFFFCTLTKKGFLPGFFRSKYINKKVKDFVKRMVPDKYNNPNTMNRGRLLLNDEYMTPEYILNNDSFFDKLLIKN